MASCPPTDNGNEIAVGRLVEVRSRTWPGINKPGGIARVTQVHWSSEHAVTHVDVQYILGNSKEKQVPMDYVQLTPQYEVHSRTRSTALRDRSVLLGRCRRCGSLRTDCGSCDWASEEQDGTKSTIAPLRKRHDSSKTRMVIEKDNDDSSSASSSSEEDVLLQELLQQNQRKYRKYLRYKMTFNQSYSHNKEVRKSRKPKEMAAPKNDNLATSSSSDEEDLLLNNNAGRYQAYLKHKAEWQRRQRRSQRRHRSSVLESLAQTPNKNSTDELQIDDTPPSKKHIRRRVRQETHQTTSEEDITGNSPLVGAATYSSSSDASMMSFARPQDDSSDDNYALMSPGMEDYTYSPPPAADGSQTYQDMIALSQFIQPEGKEVAENLPQDTVDRTKHLRYHELPQFFDTTANKIEDDWMPDWKLRIAKLTRAIRQFEHQLSVSTTTVDPDKILQECQEMVGKVRGQLIRNGTDQCRVALHKLMDDRLYRKNRSKISSQQRKLCRGSGILEARNLRMDALDNAAEDLVRKLRDVAQACEDQVHQSPLAAASIEDSEDDFGNEFFAPDDQSPTSVTPTSPNTSNSGPPSPVFHPHMHASRVRPRTEHFVIHTKKRAKKTKNIFPSRKRVKSSSSHKRTRNTMVLYPSSTNPERIRASPQEVAKENEMEPPDGSTDQSSARIFLDAEASSGPPRSAGPQQRESRKPTTRRTQVVNHPENAASQHQIRASRSANQEAQVPTFDLFEEPGTGLFSDRQTERPSWRGERAPRRSRVPISKRMQAFLEANAGDGCDWWQEEVASAEDRRESVPRRRGRRRPRHQDSRRTFVASTASCRDTVDRQPRRVGDTVDRQPRRVGQAEEGIPMQEENEDATESASDRQAPTTAPVDDGSLIVTENMFAQLKQSCGEETLDVPVSHTVNISETCRQLENAYPYSPSQCLTVLGRLHTALPKQITTAENPNVVFLKAGFGLLQNHGTLTLHELITTKSPLLKVHVQLLSECLCALNRVSKDNVQNPGSMLERVLTNRQNFIDTLVLQLVDTVYALLHPGAWALKISNRSQILAVLCPLRDALAKVTPLIEAASRCIVERLGPQQWRRGLTPNHAFVSCIGANDWKNYLLNGVPPPKPSDVRFQALGKVWPRLETEALWSLLAYLARPESMSDDRSNFRWQLLSKLYSCGVLAGDESETKSAAPLPPSKAQLSACEKEIGFFTTLLCRGNLDSLPSSDSVVVNLIRRGLTLQADDYIANEKSRQHCYPETVSKSGKKFVARLWKSSHPLSFMEPDSLRARSDSSRSISFNDTTERETLSAENLLMPSSNILKRCLELLPTWIRRLPDKKARQNRLHRALNTLRGALLSDFSERSKHEPNNTNQSTSFESAFGKHPQEGGTSGLDRAGGFIGEAVAWLRIVEQTSLSARESSNAGKFPNFSSSESVSEIWEIVANDSMKARRTALMEKHKSSRNSFTGDSFHLFIAAKVMASVALLQLNICPWFLDTESTTTRFPTSTYDSEDEVYNKDAFVFSMSCIFTCLDCLCDLPNESPFTAHIYSIVSLVFTNCTASFHLNGMCPVKSQTKDSLLPVLSPVLVRCFNVQINSPGGPDDSMSFRLLLCAIRSFSSFLAIGSQSAVSSQTQSEAIDNVRTNSRSFQQVDSEEDDIWGSIDDALLSSIDLNSNGCSGESVNAPCPEEQLLKCLQNAIQQSKPSERFLIFQDTLNSSRKDRLQMSAHGKHTVAKDVERICDCLVSLQVIDTGNRTSPHLSHLVVQPIQSFFDDGNDAQFSSQVSQRLCSELTSLSKTYKTCRNFVKAHSESIAFNFLGVLLDSRRLEIFPSCNLENIRDNAGDAAGEQALALLDAFNTCSQDQVFDGAIEAMARIQRKRRRKAYCVWNSCRALGQALSPQTTVPGSPSFEETLAVVLQDKDTDLSSKPESFLDSKSLEQETLECLRLLRTLVSVCAECNSNHRASFESLVAFLLSLVISNTLKIVQSLKYQDGHESRNPDGDKTMRWIKTKELLGAYLEMIVTLTSWILRESRSDVSDQWTSLQVRLRDSFLSPVLRREDADLTVSFQKILTASISVITGIRNQAADATVAGIPGCSKYLDGLVDRFVRRSRQLLIASSKCSHFLSIQSYLVEAVVGSAGDSEDRMARILGAAFNPSVTNACLSTDNPLQEGIDEYICFVEKNLINNDVIDRMKATESNFLDTFVLPRLNHSKTGIDIKRRLLRLISHILKGETDMFSLDKSILRSLVKGLRFSLLQSFKQSIVDDSFVSVIFACSSALANVPTLLGDGSKQTLISWSRGVVNDPTKKSMLDLSQEEASGAYVWLCFSWLHNIGSIVVNIGNVGEENNLIILKLCCSNQQQQEGGSDIGLGLIREENDLTTSHGLLSRAENIMFPSRRENNPNVVNVYAKAAPPVQTSIGLLEDWTPSRAVRKSAKEFMAEVVSLG